MTTTRYHLPQAVMTAALLETHVTRDELLGTHRRLDIIEARNHIAYSMWLLGRVSYHEIARAFGRRSHSSAWHQVNKARQNGGPEFAARVLARLEQAKDVRP